MSKPCSMANYFIKSFLLLGFICCSSHLALSQVFEDMDFRNKAFAGIEHLYNMEYEEASRIFEGLKSKHPEHPAPYFLLALNRWWETYVSYEMTTYHNYILTHLNKAIELNKAIKGQEAYILEYTFFQYMCQAFKARLYTLRKEWWKAANAGRKALPYLKAGFKYTDQSPEFYFGSGIYHYYASEYPKAHPYIQPLMIFFPNGNKAKGIWELKQASTLPNYASPEAMFYLGDIYLKDSMWVEGLNLYRKLSNRFPNSTWFKMEYARALILNQKFETANGILDPIIAAYEKNKKGFTNNIHTNTSHYTTYLLNRVYYFRGRSSLMLNGDGKKALGYIEKSLKLANIAGLEDDEFLPFIWQFYGMALDQEEERDKAIIAYKKVLRLDQNQPVKAMAKKYLESPFRFSPMQSLRGLQN